MTRWRRLRIDACIVVGLLMAAGACASSNEDGAPEHSPPTTESGGNNEVATWADAHLDDLAAAHGSLTGIVNAMGVLAGGGRVVDARDLCEAADRPDLGAPGASALEAYPGGTDLVQRWQEFVDASRALFNACARVSPGEVESNLDQWNGADSVFGLTVVQVVDEADHTVDPEGPRVMRYDEVRENARLETQSAVLETAG